MMDLLPSIDSTSLLYLAAFSVITISCIVISATSSSNSTSNSQPSTNTVYPISSSPAEELNAYACFINYYSFSKQVPDLENHDNSNHSDKTSSNSNQSLQLEQQFSQVTLTFGSDKPEVYMKMATHAHNKLPCRCPCKHQSPELAQLPHISNTSTISTDLSAHNHTFDSDSLSTFASNKQLATTSDQQFSSQLQSTTDSLASSSTETPVDTTPNHTWLVITDTSTSVKNSASASHGSPAPVAQHLVVKKDLTCLIAYDRMKTMIPFIDPAIFIQWIAVKILISLYVLAKGFYQQALKKPVVRRFKQQQSQFSRLSKRSLQ